METGRKIITVLVAVSATAVVATGCQVVRVPMERGASHGGGVEEALNQLTMQLLQEADYIAEWKNGDSWDQFVKTIGSSRTASGNIAVIVIQEENEVPSREEVMRAVSAFGQKGFYLVNIVKRLSWVDSVAVGIRMVPELEAR